MPVSAPPRPGSMTMRLPVSCGPDRRTSSSSLIACGEPPVTRVPSSSSERRVAGPQMPSAAMPDLALERAERVVGLRAEVAVDPAGVEAEILQSRLQRCDVVAVQRRGQLVDQRTGAEAVRRLLE